MTFKDRRAILSLSFLGNITFLLLSCVMGTSFFVFLGFLSKNIYKLILSDNPYYLLATGLVFLTSGFSLLVLRNFFSKSQNVKVFLYLPVLCLVSIYVISILSVFSPFTSVVMGYVLSVSCICCLFVFATNWKRSQGLAPVVMFFVGAGIAGIYDITFGLKLVDVLYFVRLAFFVYLVVLIFYEFSFLGFLKTTKKASFVPAIIALIFIVYPVNSDLIYEKTDIQGYDHLSSYLTSSRKVEVQMSRAETPEHILFLENGRVTQKFPYSYEQELSLCFAILENKASGNILIAGDAPLGLFSVLSKIPKIGVVHYFPSDPSYVKLWNNFASNDILNTYVVIPDSKQLMERYGMIIFFPPTVRGYGTKAGLSRSVFRLLSGKVSSSGTFTIVLSKDIMQTELASNLEDRLKNILYTIYGSVYESQLNGFKFLFASKDPKNISSDLSVLKYRYLSLGVQYDYSSAKQFFENSGLSVKNIVPKKLPNHYLIVIILLIIFFLILLVMFLSRKNNRSIDVTMFSLALGSWFGLSMLINQMFSVSSYSVFVPFLGVFFISSIVGVVLGTFKNWVIKNNKYWTTFLLLLIFIIITYLFIFLGGTAIYPFLIGLSFGLVFVFFNAPAIKVVSLYLMGVGLGLSCLFLLAQRSLALSEIAFILTSVSVLILIYNVLVLRRER